MYVVFLDLQKKKMFVKRVAYIIQVMGGVQTAECRLRCNGQLPT